MCTPNLLYQKLLLLTAVLVAYFGTTFDANGQHLRILDITELEQLSLTECGLPDTLFYQVENVGTASTTNLVLDIQLAPNIEFVKALTPSTTLSNNPNNPQLGIRNLSPDEDALVTIIVKAMCGADSERKLVNLLNLNYTADGSDFEVTKVSQDFSIATYKTAIQLEPIGNMNVFGEPTDTIIRQYYVLNTGIGADIDSIYGWFTSERNTQLIDLQIDGQSIELTEIEDTFRYALRTEDYTGAGFAVGDTIIITEVTYVIECTDPNLPSQLGVYWGCDGIPCENAILHPNIQPPFGVPDVLFRNIAEQKPCYGATDRHGIMIINRGNQSITDIDLDVYQTNRANVPWSEVFYSYFVKNSCTIDYGNGAIDSIQPESVQYIRDAWIRGCYPDQQPIDFMRFNLGRVRGGDTAYLWWETYKCCVSDDICEERGSAGSLNSIFRYEGGYSNACETLRFPINQRASGGLKGTNLGTGIDIEGPYYWYDGDTGTMSISFPGNGLNAMMDSSGYYDVVISLPAGYKQTESDSAFLWLHSDGVVSRSPVSVLYNADSSQITARYPGPKPFNVKNSTINFDVTLSCDSDPTNGAKPITVQIFTVPSLNCGSTEPCRLTETCPTTFSVRQSCATGPCLRGGISVRDISAERITLGWPDNNDDGLRDSLNGQPLGRDAIDKSLINLDRVFIGDTFTTRIGGVVSRGVESPDTFRFGYATIHFDEYGNNIDIVGASITIETVDGNTYFLDNIPSINYELNLVDYSPDSIRGLGTIPSHYSFSEGDYLSIDIDFELARNIGQEEEADYFSPIFYLSDVPNPAPEDRYQCNTRYTNLTFVGYHHSVVRNIYRTLNTCATVGGGFPAYFGMGCCDTWGTNRFPYEYRPFALRKSATIDMVEGYDYGNITLTLYHTAGTGAYHTYVIRDVEPDSIVDDRLFFDFAQLYTTNGGHIPPSDEGWSSSFSLPVNPNCLTVADTYIYDTIRGANEFIETVAHFETVSGQGITRFMRRKPVLSLDVIGTPVDLTKSQVAKWRVGFSNFSQYTTAENIWMGLDPSSTDIRIDSIKDLVTNQLLPETNGIFVAADVAPSRQSNEYEVYASYINCAIDTFDLHAGWGCDEPPTVFGITDCRKDTLTLVVDPQIPEIQVVNISEQDTLIELCEQLSYTVSIKNVDPGYAYDNQFTIQLPPGFGMEIIPGSAMFAFADGTLSPIPDPTSIGNDRYWWHIDSLNEIMGHQGLTGFDEAPFNEYRIHFELSTNCNFTSGDIIKFIADAERSCGAELPASVESSLPIYINDNTPGTDKVYIPQVDFPSIYNCQETVEVKAKFINASDDFLTEQNDGYEIELPEGFIYVPRSTSVKKGNVDRSPIITSGAQQRVFWKVGAGISPDDSAVWTFRVRIPENLTLGTTWPFFARTLEQMGAQCITNNMPCDIKAESFIIYDEFEVYDALSYPDNFCLEDEITFSNEMETGVLMNPTYSWSIGPGLRSRERWTNNTRQNSFSISTSTPDAYPITFTVLDETLPCAPSYSDTILIGGFPADITIDSLEGCFPAILHLSDQTSTDNLGNVSTIRHEWKVGDEIFSQATPPIVELNKEGSYLLSHSILDNAGCTTIAHDSVRIAPIDAFFDQRLVCTDDSLRFELQSTDIYTALHWNLGDGTTSDKNLLHHQYNTSGTYRVSLQVEGPLGCKDSIVQAVEVSLYPSPEAAFDFENDSICAGGELIITNQANKNQLTSTITYQVDFGNGMRIDTSYFESLVFSQYEIGQFPLTISVVDSICTNSFEETITAIHQPTGSFTIDADTGCAPFMATINLEGNNYNSTVVDFGNGVITNGMTSNSSTYSTSGLYYPIVTLVNQKICYTPLDSGFIQVGDSVRVQFDVSHDLACIGTTVDFTIETEDDATNPILNKWLYHNSNRNTLVQVDTNFIKLYDTAISDSFSLVVEDALGCTAPVVKIVEVIDTLTFAPPLDVSICPGATAKFIAGAFTSIPEAQFSWMNMNGDTISSALDHEESPAFTSTYCLFAACANIQENYCIEVVVHPQPEVKIDVEDTLRLWNPSSAELRAIVVDSGSGALQFSWWPEADVSCNDCQNTITTAQSSRDFMVEMTDQYNCITTDTIHFQFIEDCFNESFKTGKAFTPNGDGVNDIFEIKSRDLSSISEVQIYNRWGELLHKSVGQFNGWSGYFNNKPCPTASYVWRMEGECITGDKISKRGSVTLIR